MRQTLFFLAAFGVQLALALAALGLITLLDWAHGLKADKAAVGMLLAGCGTGAGYLLRIRGQEPGAVWAAYSILAVYMTVCVITDFQTCKIYNFLQLPAAAAGAALCLLHSPPPESGAGLIVFALLQSLLFGRMYGAGDVMVFQICGLYLVAGGGGFQTLLLHMALAVGILGGVQAVKRNINKRGNLKEPVPFVPYIAVSLLWFL